MKNNLDQIDFEIEREVEYYNVLRMRKEDLEKWIVKPISRMEEIEREMEETQKKIGELRFRKN